jgi:hypothetical protein
VIKKAYFDKYPDLQTGFTVAVADTETDVVNGTEQIIMMTVTSKEKCFTAVDKAFVGTYPSFIESFKEKMELYLGDVIKARNIKYDIVIVDSPVDCVKACMEFVHELKPDLLAFWNVDFDITKIMKACESACVDPKDIFCDPSIPKEYRKAYFKEDKKNKSGPINTLRRKVLWQKESLQSVENLEAVDDLSEKK